MIRSIAFHPKAMNDINNNGRSSDLFPLWRLPGFHNNQWLRMSQHFPTLWEDKTYSYGDSS